MALGISIQFDGNCREAVTFYAQLFDLPLPVFVTYGETDTSLDTNVQMSAAGQERVLSAGLTIEGVAIDFSDMPDNFDFQRGNATTLTLTYNDVEKAGTVFDALAEGGMVFMPFDEVPGRGHYGMLADQYGVSWIVRTGEI